MILIIEVKDWITSHWVKITFPLWCINVMGKSCCMSKTHKSHLNFYFHVLMAFQPLSAPPSLTSNEVEDSMCQRFWIPNTMGCKIQLFHTKVCKDLCIATLLSKIYPSKIYKGEMKANQKTARERVFPLGVTLEITWRNIKISLFLQSSIKSESEYIYEIPRLSSRCELCRNHTWLHLNLQIG